MTVTSGRGQERWRERLGIAEPEFAILAAVVVVALRDITSGTARDAADAWTYLRGPNFRADCDILGLRPERVLDLLHRPGRDPEPTNLTDDQIVEIYREYTAHETLSLRALARRHHTTAATLSRRFARQGLTARAARQHRAPRRTHEHYH